MNQNDYTSHSRERRRRSTTRHATSGRDSLASKYRRIPSATGAVTRRASTGNVDPDAHYDATSRNVQEERARTARRAARSPQRKARSVGADVLSFPAGRIGGYNVRLSNRPYGRGTTARRVQDQRGEEGIPVRAAVYTQDAGLRERVRIARRWGTGMPLGMWQVILVGALVAVLAVVAIMGPLRDYYAAWRDSGLLQAEYEALVAINEDLTGDVERLNSLAGVEDEARRRGYVYPDEESLIVEGLEEATESEQAEVQKAVEAYESTLPWYVPFLDGLLGYTHE